MLLNDFFYIRSTSNDETQYIAAIEINSQHTIFDGHFPGRPVVPGVCLMQMIKEITEVIIKKQTLLIKADEMKFLSVINPQENNLVTVELKITSLENNSHQVVAVLKNLAGIYFKFKGSFMEEKN